MKNEQNRTSANYEEDLGYVPEVYSRSDVGDVAHAQVGGCGKELASRCSSTLRVSITSLSKSNAQMTFENDLLRIYRLFLWIYLFFLPRN